MDYYFNELYTILIYLFFIRILSKDIIDLK